MTLFLDRMADAMGASLHGKALSEETLREAARAGLAACREPSNEMEDAGTEAAHRHSPTSAVDLGTAAAVWTGMVDEALK